RERTHARVQGVPGERGEAVMTVAVAARSGVWAERRRRVAELRARQGFARQLLDFYGALLGVQEAAFLEAAASPPPAADLAAYVAETVLPGIVDVGVAVGPDSLRSDLIRRFGAFEAHELVRGWMRGEEQTMVDRFLARASLGPVLEALDQDAKAQCAGPRDARHCPECGGPPQLSFSAAASDDLATGRRFLVCARCAAAWGFARMTCAGCGEDASARLSVFSEHGTTSGERGSVVRGLPTGAPAAAHRRQGRRGRGQGAERAPGQQRDIPRRQLRQHRGSGRAELAPRQVRRARAGQARDRGERLRLADDVGRLQALQAGELHGGLPD